jgi:hypothetical protein
VRQLGTIIVILGYPYDFGGSTSLLEFAPQEVSAGAQGPAAKSILFAYLKDRARSVISRHEFHSLSVGGVAGRRTVPASTALDHSS